VAAILRVNNSPISNMTYRLSAKILLVLYAVSSNALAETVNIAVASNFASAAKALIQAYPNIADDKLNVIPGSTGKLYAQIKNGAPFDLFFAADRKRPTLLQSEGFVTDGESHTYALGKLVLWSPTHRGYLSVDKLLAGDFRHLAMANPRLAPYGDAARQALAALGYWDDLQGRLVIGESIGQAFQYVESGNAEMGLLALSQFSGINRDYSGGMGRIPDDVYTPIEQQVVLLTDNSGAREFLQFVVSDVATDIIRLYGYGVP
jgi:molybdate transport system substrate-binding protein